MSRLLAFSRPRRRAGVGLAVTAALIASLAPTLGARAQVDPAGLELRAASDHVTVVKYRGDSIYLDLGVYLAAVGAPFEVWLTRPDYSQPIQAEQAVYAADGSTSMQPVPSDALDDWDGFKDFLTMEIEKGGEEVDSLTFDFCPNSYDRQRVNDSGPDAVTYPDNCSTNPFTRGNVWGIDEGWAVNTWNGQDSDVHLPVGDYDVTLTIDQRYIDLFDLDPATSTTTVKLTIEKQSYSCDKGCIDSRRRPSSAPSRRAEAVVPTDTSPSDNVLPDLVALPAWSINARNGRKKESLQFSAAVWAAGDQSMVVEGFRRRNEELMDAYQYFYKNGRPVGRAPVGNLEYDDRTGHEHWHFLQFARYRLLDESQQEVVVSKKEAFCLAPTDAIDLTLPNSVWTPYSTGLATACGGPTALWVREVLPLGWGDTYFQSLPGQSLEITDLPNGTYYIEVTANPSGSLYEQSDANNTQVRQVIVKGKPGHRRVETPPWNGIDTETPDDGGEDGVLRPH